MRKNCLFCHSQSSRHYMAWYVFGVQMRKEPSGNGNQNMMTKSIRFVMKAALATTRSNLIQFLLWRFLFAPHFVIHVIILSLLFFIIFFGFFYLNSAFVFRNVKDNIKIIFTHIFVFGCSLYMYELSYET